MEPLRNVLFSGLLECDVYSLSLHCHWFRFPSHHWLADRKGCTHKTLICLFPEIFFWRIEETANPGWRGNSLCNTGDGVGGVIDSEFRYILHTCVCHLQNRNYFGTNDYSIASTLSCCIVCSTPKIPVRLLCPWLHHYSTPCVIQHVLIVDSSVQFLLKTGFDTNYTQKAEIAR